MPATKIFVSYPRTASAEVRELAGHLERLGEDVWLDQELSGGQEWWDVILERIRSSDCFMFTVCEDALESRACRAELDYAYRTQRVIVPVVVGPPVPDQVLPRYLSRLQHVEANDPMQVARALLQLPEPRPLPSPLPEPPPVPISYLDELADAVEQPSLSLSDQHSLVGALRQRLSQGEDRDAALTLLHRLRRRSDVYAGVANEIDAEVARHQVAPEEEVVPEGGVEVGGEPAGEPDTAAADGGRPPGGPGHPGMFGPPDAVRRPPPPQPPPPPVRRRGKVVAALAAGVLALGGVGAAVALGGGGGDDPNPPTPTPTPTPEPSTPEPAPDEPRPDPVEPVEVVSVTPGELPDSYGDDPYFDGLADNCYDGSLFDCDTLWAESPPDSAYEAFGATCGAVSYFTFEGTCAGDFDPELNAALPNCNAGDMVACDDLYLASDIGSLYEAFGAYCGLLSPDPLFGTCEATFGA